MGSTFERKRQGRGHAIFYIHTSEKNEEINLHLDYKYRLQNIEFWFARELMLLLCYERRKNFDKAIFRAKDSCQTIGIEVLDHFREVTKMVCMMMITAVTT